MALPSDKEFTVSYKLIADANVTGNYTLGGRFSFIADNERSNIDITPKTITISTEGDLTSNNQDNTNATVNNSVPTIAINANRTIEKIADGKFKITVKITKENVFGFAKITENIPTGFIATMIETQGGIFSFKNNEVKILWMALPSANEFTVVYNLQAQDAINDSYAINGTISYLENNVTKKYEMPSNSFTLNQKEPSFVDVGTNENSNSGNTNDRINNSTTSNKVTSTPNPETGITYKVQIAALKTQKSVKYIAKALHVSQKISIEAHEGWSKYIIGSHTEYKNARDARNKIRKNVKRAFVSAYNQGKRITVQEALMISNQKWYK